MDTSLSVERSAKILPLYTKIGFGIADIGVNLFFTVMSFWALTYLTDTVQLTPALAGIAVMVSKCWDAVADTLTGYISDNTRSRWGRRRPFLLFGAVPFGLFFWNFFTAPPLHGQTVLFLWAVISLCMLNTAVTSVNIPYTALSPELTQDCSEQTSLNAYRFICAGIGMLFGSVCIMPIISVFSSKSAGFSAAAGIVGIIITVTVLITFFSVREPAHCNQLRTEKESLITSYGRVFKNKTYIILLTAFVLHIIALNFLQGMIVYYLKYIRNAEFFSSTIMGCFLFTAIACIPVAAKISNRYGKHRSYQIGFAVIGAGALLVFFIGHTVKIRELASLFVFAGVGAGFAFATPWAMLPDVIIKSTAAGNAKNEGCYYGVWIFASKLGQAVSVGISGILLSRAGYAANTVQSERTLQIIRLIVGPLPAGICLLGVIAVQAYYRSMQKD